MSMRLGKCIWSEDECTSGLPGHETHFDAWKRLFDEDLPKDKLIKELAVEKEDLGDTFNYLMTNGYILQLSYDGWSIYQPLEPPFIRRGSFFDKLKLSNEKAKEAHERLLIEIEGIWDAILPASAKDWAKENKFEFDIIENDWISIGVWSHDLAKKVIEKWKN